MTDNSTTPSPETHNENLTGPDLITDEDGTETSLDWFEREMGFLLWSKDPDGFIRTTAETADRIAGDKTDPNAVAAAAQYIFWARDSVYNNGDCFESFPLTAHGLRAIIGRTES